MSRETEIASMTPASPGDAGKVLMVIRQAATRFSAASPTAAV